MRVYIYIYLYLYIYICKYDYAYIYILHFICAKPMYAAFFSLSMLGQLEISVLLGSIFHFSEVPSSSPAASEGSRVSHDARLVITRCSC